MIFPNQILAFSIQSQLHSGNKKGFFVSKGSRESTSVETCLHLFNCLFVSTVSLPYLSLLVKGEESVVLCGDLLAQCLAYTCLTVSSCPPVSQTYLSLSLSKGKRASTSVENCLHLSNCLCFSTCLSNLPVSLCKF
jgi:hypothetical protein